MALVRTSDPTETMPQPGGPTLKLVPDLHPPQEGVFDSGEHHFFQGSVKVGRDEVIWTLELPENLAYDGLATFVPGFSGIHGSSYKPRTAVADEGIAISSYNPARKGKSWYETARRPQVLHAKTVHEVGKAIMTSREIQKKAPNVSEIDFEKQLLIGHSMGGLGITEAAINEPGRVDMLVKLAACGYGHPTLWELAQDVPKGAHLGVIHELIPSLLGGDIAPTMHNVRDLLNYFKHFRALVEGNSCLHEDSRDKVAELRQQGIQVAYQAYEHDILVRADPSVADYVDHYDVMAHAGHLAPIRKSAQVARWVSDVVLSR